MTDEDPLTGDFLDNAPACGETSPGPGLFADTAMHQLTHLGRLQRLAPQTIFMVEGDIVDTVHIILEGRVRVFSSDPNGGEIVLSICGPGEFLGEMALDGGHRSASVRALEKACPRIRRVARWCQNACRSWR